MNLYPAGDPMFVAPSVGQTQSVMVRVGLYMLFEPVTRKWRQMHASYVV